MKTASVRDLRYRFPEAGPALESGQAITIAKRGRVVGEFSPRFGASVRWRKPWV